MPIEQILIPHSRPSITEEDVALVTDALRKGCLAEGNYVRQLEDVLSGMFDGFEVVVTGSGTAALALMLTVLGLKAEDAVVIPSYTCRSLYAAVAYAGATPVCADCGNNSVCLSPQSVRVVMNSAVRAVIAPHMFGFEVNVDGLRASGAPVIEDCAQGLGGITMAGEAFGTLGDAAILSFYATKLVPAGEGGACLVRNSELADRLRNLRHCDETPLHPRAFNFKMSDLHAALAFSQISRLSANIKRRAEIAEMYDQVFGRWSWRVKHNQMQNVCFRYLLEVPDGRVDDFLHTAAERRIVCRRPVEEPLHRALGGKCPRADDLHARLVSVPLYPGLADEELDRICNELPRALLP